MCPANEWKGGDRMERYERPVILATYTVDELAEEAAVCCGKYELDFCPPNG